MSKLNQIKSFQFQQTCWKDSLNEILSVRHKVFIIEQHFDGHVLCDINDPDCYHIVVRNYQKSVVASGRISSEGKIGRIAVTLPYRGIGIGTKLLDQLVQLGRSMQLANLSLNAEFDNHSFYDQQKFSATGPVYMKFGVPYQMLSRKLA